MTATTTALVPLQPAFSDAERLALADFLAGYRGLTREAYALDLRQFTTWCRARSLNLFAARRADIEGFARNLEARGRARATVTRRLCTIAGFYKYAVEEDLLEHSPAAHVRRPRVDYESHAAALDRNELGALLVAADQPGCRDRPSLCLTTYPASVRSATMPQAVRSVTPVLAALSRSRTPGSWAMPSSTRAWLVRKLQPATPQSIADHFQK